MVPVPVLAACTPAVANSSLLMNPVSVCLNSLADLVVLHFAIALRATAQPRLMRRMRQGSGAVLCALGLSLAAAQRAR